MRRDECRGNGRKWAGGEWEAEGKGRACNDSVAAANPPQSKANQPSSLRLAFQLTVQSWQSWRYAQRAAWLCCRLVSSRLTSKATWAESSLGVWPQPFVSRLSRPVVSWILGVGSGAVNGWKRDKGLRADRISVGQEMKRERGGPRYCRIGGRSTVRLRWDTPRRKRHGCLNPDRPGSPV